MSPKEYLISKDSILAQIIKGVNLPIQPSTGNVFHDLMSCVIEQQIHYRSTKKMFEKMLSSTGLTELTLDNFSKFEEAFADKKISEKKYDTIASVLEVFSKQKWNWKGMSDDEVKETLSQIKGVGPWTQEMILLYTLDRPNVFPLNDYHLKIVLKDLYGAEKRTEIRMVAEQFSPYESLAVKYLLHWKSIRKKPFPII